MGAPEVTAELQRVAPAAAAGSSITPSGTAWANSAYAQVVASTGAAITVVGVIVNPGVAADFELDIAKGVATSEVVVARVAGNVETLAQSFGYFLPINIPIDNIPISTRVAIRLRKSSTSTVAWTVKLVYYNTVSGTIGVTANVPALAPSAAAGVSVTPNGTAWANSAYGELSASLANIVCLGLVVNPAGTITTGGDEFEVDVATGAATSEVVKGTLCGTWETFAGGAAFLRFRVPLELAGTNRVAVRMRKTGTAVTAWTFKLLYVSTAGFGSQDVKRTTQPQKCLPYGAALSGSDAGTTAWANAPWVQLSAGLGAAIVITSLIFDSAMNAEYEVEIGKGAATSEVVVATTGDNRESAIGQPHQIPFEIPVDNLPASTRIAARHRKGSVTAGVQDVGLHYYEKAL